jgi:hypothetical protein
VEAAQNRVTAATEEFWQTAISSGAISGFYNLVAKVIELATALGGLKSILILAATAMIYFNSTTILSTLTSIYWTVGNMIVGFYGLATSTNVATAAMVLFNTTNPIGWIALLVGALALLATSFETAAEKIDKINQKIADGQAKIDDLKNSVKSAEELRDTYKELKPGFDAGTLTDEEELKLTDAQNRLKEILPTLSGYYDEYGNFIMDAAEAERDLAEEIRQGVIEKVKEQQALEDTKSAMQAELLLIELRKKARADAGKVTFGGGKSYTKNFTDAEIAEMQSKWGDALDQMISDFEKKSKEGQQAFVDALIASGSEGEELANSIFIPLMNKIEDLKSTPIVIPVEIDLANAEAELDESLKELVDIAMDMIKDIKEAEKDALEDQLDNLKKEFDAKEEIYKNELDEIKRISDEKKTQLERELSDLKRVLDAQKRAVQDRLDNYKRMLDAERERLELEKDAADYENEQEDNQKKLADIESELAELALDNSEEGIARRLQLEAEAAELRKQMGRDEADHAYDLAMKALDEEERRAEEEAANNLKELEDAQRQADFEYELQIRSIEDAETAAEAKFQIAKKELDDEYEAQKAQLQDKIAAIEDYLKQEGTIRTDALEMIKSQNEEFYESLLEWNEKYGSGINDEIIKMWENAILAVQEYNAAVLASPTPDGTPIYPPNVPRFDDELFHEGVKSGFVGGKSTLRTNEQFATLMKGELVLNSSQMDAFMRNTLPALAGIPQTTSINNNGGASVTMNVNVAGNLDKSVLPDMEKVISRVVKQLNDNLTGRGLTRRAESYSV